MFLQIAELFLEVILIKLQVAFGIFLAIVNATAGVQFSFQISFKSSAAFLWPFYMHFMLPLLSCHFTFSSFPSPFEFNGSESYLEMVVVMRFLKPPIISKRVSSIKPEFRLSPLFVLSQWNTIGIKEDCSSDTQLCSVFFSFPLSVVFMAESCIDLHQLLCDTSHRTAMNPGVLITWKQWKILWSYHLTLVKLIALKSLP